MKLYETYVAIEQLWMQVEDILTGEQTEGADGLSVDPDMALDWIEEALSKIEDERDAKALNIACLIKNFRAEANALKQEKQRLAKRQQAAERTMERLTNYLQQFLQEGQKLKDSRTTISWRKSEGVRLTGAPQTLPAQYQRVRVEANLTAIKSALKSGESVEGAAIETRNNIQIR